MYPYESFDAVVRKTELMGHRCKSIVRDLRDEEAKRVRREIREKNKAATIPAVDVTTTDDETASKSVEENTTNEEKKKKSPSRSMAVLPTKEMIEAIKDVPVDATNPSVDEDKAFEDAMGDDFAMMDY